MADSQESETSLTAQIKRRILASGVLGVESPPDLERSLTLLGAAAAAEKSEVDAANARRTARSESVRFWVSIAGPLIAVGATVGTLVFQINQAHDQSERTVSSQAETQWREAVGTLFNQDGFKATGGAIMLRSFLSPLPAKDQSLSPLQERHRSEAFVAATHFLGTNPLPSVFEILIDDVCGSITFDNKERFLQMLRQMDDNLGLTTQAHNQQLGQPRPATTALPLLPGIASEPQNQPDVPPAVARILEGQYERACQCFATWASNFYWENLDLTDLHLRSSDLSNLTAKKLILARTSFEHCTIEKADLCGASEFESSSWIGTAWWRADGIEKPLLDFLSRKFPFSPSEQYAGVAATSREYTAAVARLQRTPCVVGAGK
jgi:hypothetical protein